MQKEQPYNYDNGLVGPGNIKFTIQRIGDEHFGGIHIKRPDGSTTPIADMNDVQVFLINLHPVADWVDARAYQKWAYFDFLYSRDLIRHYKSCGSALGIPGIEIPIPNLAPNIIFSMSRNDNGSIYYERNDAIRSRVRISDNHHARMGYCGFFSRMTDNSGFLHPIAHPVAYLARLPIPVAVIAVQTNIEEFQCCICFDIQQNIRYQPCNHTITCSTCYLRQEKPRECALCKQFIQNIIQYTPS